ncbi:hypothetical protein HUJ04_011400 [Dendroctonus ponderosae]|nr:hypothetical protein HUJ04_011400 [Dendroctonus ponderosae]
MAGRNMSVFDSDEEDDMFDNMLTVTPRRPKVFKNRDDRLSWSVHIDFLSGKLFTAIFILRDLRDTLELNVLRNVYFALFHSKIHYGVTLWGGSPHFIRVFRLQKRAI